MTALTPKAMAQKSEIQLRSLGVEVPAAFKKAQEKLLHALMRGRADDATAEEKQAGRENICGVHIGEKQIKGKSTGTLSVVVTVKRKLPVSKIAPEYRIPEQIRIGTTLVPVDVQVQAPTKTVFLSFSHQDYALASEVRSILTAAGLDVRGVKENTSEGDLAAELRAAIKACDLFVILVTLAALESAWLTFEVSIAAGWLKPTYLVTTDLGNARLPAHLQSFPSFTMQNLHQLVETVL